MVCVCVCFSYLLPVLFILNRIHSTAGFGIQHEVKASIFAKAAGIAQEGVLLIVIYGSGREENNS